MSWIEEVHPLYDHFPPARACLICGSYSWKKYFYIQRGPEEPLLVHLECFKEGEFKFNKQTKLIYWVGLGG